MRKTATEVRQVGVKTGSVEAADLAMVRVVESGEMIVENESNLSEVK